MIVASGCVALSLLISAREFLFVRSLSIFEVPLGVSGTILFVWGADARMDRAQAKWLCITSIVVNLLVLAILVALPDGDPTVRLFLTAGAVICLAGAIFKLGSP